MNKAILLSKLEQSIKQSLDNLESVNLSNTQKSRALALEVINIIDAVFIQDEREDEKHVSNR